MKSKNNKKNIFIGITGASGSCYSINLIQHLSLVEDIQIYLCASEIAKKVILFETGIDIKKIASQVKAYYFEANQLFAPISSGTFNLYSSIIIPCSMGTMARIANGISSNLIERCADVTIKKKKL